MGDGEGKEEAVNEYDQLSKELEQREADSQTTSTTMLACMHLWVVYVLSPSECSSEARQCVGGSVHHGLI